MNKKIKAGIVAGALLLGVSGYALLRNYAYENAPAFNNTQVVVGKDTVSMQQFYDNVRYKNNKWVYTNPEGKKINVDSLFNVDVKDKAEHSHYRNVKLKERVDTVYITQGDKKFKEKNNSEYMFKIGALDSLPNMPAMGRFDYDKLIVREFVADNPKIQNIFNKYSNSYNCTHDHEFQHYLNVGVRSWNSYSIKFVECCLDEVSANIAQCKAQRRNYLKHGKDTIYITDRFKNYREAIISGKINPTSKKLSLEEQEMMANMVFDAWMKDKFAMYVKINDGRTRAYLNKAPYAGVLENWDKHEETMKNFFNIDGYDFWPFIRKREQEVFDRITPEQKAKYAQLTRQKYRQRNHVQSMEQINAEQGRDGLHSTIRENVLTAKAISMFGLDNVK